MSDDRDYEVGKGKPPKHTQFKKGQSGNRNGRPKRDKDAAAALERVLETKVTVRENGQRREIDIMEAIFRKLLERALNGNSRDAKEFFAILERFAPERLKKSEIPTGFVVQYVLPDGKTIEDYDNEDAFGNRKQADSEK